jgi:two-component system cell cycle response regulator DivK
MLIRDLLQFRGYRVVEVSDDAQALSAAERERPAVILMDVQPGSTRRRAADQGPRGSAAHPIVAVTSFALGGDDKRAFAAGCDAYIAKPTSRAGSLLIHAAAAQAMHEGKWVKCPKEETPPGKAGFS